MFLSKLFVPLPIRLDNQNLIKFQNYLRYSARSASGNKTICPKTNDTINPFIRSRLKNYQEALQKCPQVKSKQRCKKDKLQLPCPNPPKIASDAYIHAFDETRRRALDLQIFTSNSTKKIATSLAEESAKRAALEKERAELRLKDIDATIEEIVGMSIVCGAEKKLEGYAIAEKISAKLQTWQCENDWAENHIKELLNEIECRVKERTDTAVEIVRTCRGCVSPNTLITCVEMTSADAMNIIKVTEDYVREELERIEIMISEIVKDNNAIVEKLMIDFEDEAKVLLKKLKICKSELKKMDGKCS